MYLIVGVMPTEGRAFRPRGYWGNLGGRGIRHSCVVHGSIDASYSQAKGVLFDDKNVEIYQGVKSIREEGKL